MSPDLSVVATLDDDFVTELLELPSGGSSRLERCQSVRAFDRSGRVAAVDATLLCEERGEEAEDASGIVDLATGDVFVDLGDTVIYAATFGPPGDEGLARSAVVVERTIPSPATFYDLASGDAVGTFVPDADDFVESLAMSPDGGRLVILTGSGRLIVLDVERIEAGDDQSGAIVVDVVAHTAGSKAIDVSSSGLIATGSSADGLRIWSRDGELLARVPTHQEDPPTFAFAPGNRHPLLRGRQWSRPAIRDRSGRRRAARRRSPHPRLHPARMRQVLPRRTVPDVRCLRSPFSRLTTRSSSGQNVPIRRSAAAVANRLTSAADRPTA